jgi:hypothetical protein
LQGLAWLEFQVLSQSDGTVRLIQTAFFVPKGLFGLIYWYGLYPIHNLLFSGLIVAIAQRAEAKVKPEPSNLSKSFASGI